MVSKKLYPKIKYEILPDFFIRLDHNENTTKKERQRKTLYIHVCMSRHILSEHFFAKCERKLEYSNGQLFIFCRLNITQKNV